MLQGGDALWKNYIRVRTIVRILLTLKTEHPAVYELVSHRSIRQCDSDEHERQSRGHQLASWEAYKKVRTIIGNVIYLQRCQPSVYCIVQAQLECERRPKVRNAMPAAPA
jgi:hypothetical protein